LLGEASNRLSEGGLLVGHRERCWTHETNIRTGSTSATEARSRVERRDKVPCRVGPSGP
jgi:hypothetical protein